MDATKRRALAGLLLGLVPPDGTPIGNQKLREQFLEFARTKGHKLSDADFDSLHETLIEDGTLARGKGRGGSVRRVKPADVGAFSLTQKTAPEPDEPRKAAKAKTTTHGRGAKDGEPQVLSYRHADKRKNNPQVGLVNETTDPPAPKTTWKYDPHIDPALSFDMGRADVEQIIDDAIASGDEKAMRSALDQLKRASGAFLNWAGKAERTSFKIDTVSLHVHERIDPMSILAAVSKQIKDAKAGKRSAIQPGLFDAPFENLPLREAVDFYKHERGWTNRLIAGDSLLVMNSLIQKESMSGRVQMIYIDPPYGIRYGSNFQPFVNKRDVKDRRDEDLTQEPETIKAFRDTWELGLHSYLTYLRDRLLVARELLHESGSVFVQISDENLHHVREILDEVFGASNFISLISYSTTGGFATATLSRTGDYVVWYGKSAAEVKFRRLYLRKDLEDATQEAYDQLELASGIRRPMTPGEKRDPSQIPEASRFFTDGDPTSQGEGAATATWTYWGKAFHPGAGNHWKAPVPHGIQRLSRSRRFLITPNGKLRYVRYLADFDQKPVTNTWFDIAGAVQDRADPKVFVVQTSNKIIERCLLMATDPGDLVLDPTCGSGTTAYVSEKWGRRWITCDTSRVAVTLAKQRLTTASYDYYELRYPHEGIKGGFIYQTAPHIKLGAIANNPDIDEIYERMHPAIESTLKTLNGALHRHPPSGSFEVTEGDRKGEALNFGSGAALQEWEVWASPDIPDTTLSIL